MFIVDRKLYTEAFELSKRFGRGERVGPSAIPDISRVECTHIQGIRAADVVVYLKALITQKMGALGSPEGLEKRAENRELHFAFLKYLHFLQ